MRKVALSLGSAALAILLAAFAAVTLVGETRPAQAAFRGINGKIVFVSNRAGNNEIYTISYTDNNLKRLTNNSEDDANPSWSADGKKIVFSSGRKALYSKDIFVMNANGSHKTRITDERKLPGTKADDFDPSFSPNGHQIVFVRDNQNNTGDIYKIRTDGENLTHLSTNHFEYSCCPTWSPDGTKIAYASDRNYDGYRNLVTMSPDGSGKKDIVQYEGGPLDWSPDSSQIAYSGYTENPGMEISKINADGTGTSVRLTDNEAIDSEPAFSPGGGKIVFSSNRDGDNDLYIMNADGTNVRQLTNNPHEDILPDWQPVQ